VISIFRVAIHVCRLFIKKKGCVSLLYRFFFDVCVIVGL
jgi:hypothetical protein